MALLCALYGFFADVRANAGVQDLNQRKSSLVVSIVDLLLKYCNPFNHREAHLQVLYLNLRI